MRQLKDLEIDGNRDFVEFIKETFGLVEVDHDGSDLRFKLTRLPNYYRMSNPEMRAHLFILIPTLRINSVWPGDLDKYKIIRYGVASESAELYSRKAPGIVFHRRDSKHSLYLVLEPSDEKIFCVGRLGI